MGDTNGWHEWSKHVLKELERLNTCYEKLNDRLNKIQESVTILKVKAGIWGAVGGLATLALALGVYIVKALLD